MTFLLDTDTLIFMIRGLKTRNQPNEIQRERTKVAQRIFQRARRRQENRDLVAISAITVAELEFGAWSCADYQSEISAVRRALAPFSLLSLDAHGCASHYGEIRRGLEAAGKPIGSQDTFIAAHALALDATLVTNNRSEFSRVPALRCENWAV